MPGARNQRVNSNKMLALALVQAATHNQSYT